MYGLMMPKIVKACFKSFGYDVSCNPSGNIQVTNGMSDVGFPLYVARIGADGYYAYLDNVENYEFLANTLMKYPMFGNAQNSAFIKWETLVPVNFKDNPFFKKTIDETIVMLDLMGCSYEDL